MKDTIEKMLKYMLEIKALLEVRDSADAIRVALVAVILCLLTLMSLRLWGFANYLYTLSKEARRQYVAQQSVKLFVLLIKKTSAGYQILRELSCVISRGIIDISIIFWEMMTKRYWPKVKTNIRHPLRVLRVVILVILVFKILLLFL